MSMRTAHRGFTMVELIMVIVIIGILAAVATPKMFDFKGEANEAVLNANKSVLSSALEDVRARWALSGGNAGEMMYNGKILLMDANGNVIGVKDGNNELKDSAEACAGIANALTGSNDYTTNTTKTNGEKFTVMYNNGSSQANNTTP